MVELLVGGTSSAIPLKRWVLRTRPLRGQSRYYSQYLGQMVLQPLVLQPLLSVVLGVAPKPKIASRFSSTPHLKRFGVLVGALAILQSSSNLGLAGDHVPLRESAAHPLIQGTFLT